MSKYKRLTKYNEYSHNAEVYAYSLDKDIYFDGIDIVDNENSSLAQETIDKLAELEDKIENGTLIELRDKEENLIGQQVYAIDICSYPEGEVVTNFEEDEDEIIIGFTSNEIVTANTTRGCNMYHKNGLWFLTKAEAEKKLKELQNER